MTNTTPSGKGAEALPEPTSLKPRPLLYSESVNDQQVLRDDLWIVTTHVVNRAAASELADRTARAAAPVQSVWEDEIDGQELHEIPADMAGSGLHNAGKYLQHRATLIALSLLAAERKLAKDYLATAAMYQDKWSEAEARLAARPSAAAEGKDIPIGYANLETVDFAISFYKDVIPEGYLPVYLEPAAPSAAQVAVPSDLSKLTRYRLHEHQAGAMNHKEGELVRYSDVQDMLTTPSQAEPVSQGGAVEDEPNMLWQSDDNEVFAHGPDEFASDYASNCLRPGEEAEVVVDCANRASKRTMRIAMTQDRDDYKVTWNWVGKTPTAVTAQILTDEQILSIYADVECPSWNEALLNFARAIAAVTAPDLSARDANTSDFPTDEVFKARREGADHVLDALAAQFNQQYTEYFGEQIQAAIRALRPQPAQKEGE